MRDYRHALAELRWFLRLGSLLICSFPVDPGYGMVREDEGVVIGWGRIVYFGQRNHLRVFVADGERVLSCMGLCFTRL